MKKKPKKKPTSYDRGQHSLICTALGVSTDPKAPGNTAYEAVCVLLTKIDLALQAKTLKEAKRDLKRNPDSFGFLRLYGTEKP